MVPFRLMVYVEDTGSYAPIDEVPEGRRTLDLSGTELRERLAAGREIESLDADAIVNANALAYLGPTASTRPVRDWLVSLVETGREQEAIHYYWDPVDLYAAMAQARQLHVTLFDDVRPVLATRIRDRRDHDGCYGDLL